MTKIKCDQCPEGHDELEELFACEAAHAEAVLTQMNLESDLAPKRDQRFTSRGAPLRKGEDKPKPRYVVWTRTSFSKPNEYWVVDTTTNRSIDEYTSKRAATMHAKQANAEVK